MASSINSDQDIDCNSETNGQHEDKDSELGDIKDSKLGDIKDSELGDIKNSELGDIKDSKLGDIKDSELGDIKDSELGDIKDSQLGDISENVSLENLNQSVRHGEFEDNEEYDDTSNEKVEDIVCEGNGNESVEEKEEEEEELDDESDSDSELSDSSILEEWEVMGVPFDGEFMEIEIMQLSEVQLSVVKYGNDHDEFHQLKQTQRSVEDDLELIPEVKVLVENLMKYIESQHTRIHNLYQMLKSRKCICQLKEDIFEPESDAEDIFEPESHADAVTQTEESDVQEAWIKWVAYLSSRDEASLTDSSQPPHVLQTESSAPSHCAVPNVPHQQIQGPQQQTTVQHHVPQTEASVQMQEAGDSDNPYLASGATGIQSSDIFLDPSRFGYEPTTGMYYDNMSGYYYDPELKLYYDGDSGTYYEYDYTTQAYKIHSKVDAESDDSDETKKEDDGKDEENAEGTKSFKSILPAEDELEEGEIVQEDNAAEVEIIEDITEMSVCDGVNTVIYDEVDGIEYIVSENSTSKCVNQSTVYHGSEYLHNVDQSRCGEVGTQSDVDSAQLWPPCIRIIVQATTISNMKVGNLFIVTCTGGTVGREGDHAVLIPDQNISKFHAKIVYNSEEGKYFICDFGSRNGTYLNGERLSVAKQESSFFEITHDSILQIGGTRLLCHIHPGTATCKQCEPGIVQSETNDRDSSKNLVPSQKQWKKEMKRLKKKFGLNRTKLNPTALTAASGYKDRAEVRRNVVGSQNPYEKTQVASLDESIHPNNVGYKMLSKMGWSAGQSLGKEGDGLTEPIPLVSYPDKAGLGSSSVPNLPPIASARRKLQAWAKAQERFNS